jgi:hypothetical protein
MQGHQNRATLSHDTPSPTATGCTELVVDVGAGRLCFVDANHKSGVWSQAIDMSERLEGQFYCAISFSKLIGAGVKIESRESSALRLAIGRHAG